MWNRWYGYRVQDDNDDSYEEEPDAVDVYDSDFNEDVGALIFPHF